MAAVQANTLPVEPFTPLGHDRRGWIDAFGREILPGPAA